MDNAGLVCVYTTPLSAGVSNIVDIGVIMCEGWNNTLASRYGACHDSSIGMVILSKLT